MEEDDQQQRDGPALMEEPEEVEEGQVNLVEDKKGDLELLHIVNNNEEEQQQLQAEGEEIPKVLSPKAIKLLGDPRLFPQKAKKVLGVTEPEPRMMQSRFKDDEREYQRKKRDFKKHVERISRMLPTPEQLAIPHPQRRVSEKALLILGDETLAEASRKMITESELSNAKHHPKVLQMMGEPALHPSRKVLNRMGSDMHSEQRKAQIRQSVIEAAKQSKDRRAQLMATLKALPTDEQLALPPNVQNRRISEKALRFFGDERLNDMSGRIITPEMRQNVKAKTLRILGDSELLSHKERQLLGSLDIAPVRRQQTLWQSLMQTVSFWRE